jgi:hypothetical protein
MDKYNIKENRPDLTKAEIEKGMDFDKVMKSVPSAKVFSLKKYALVGMAAAAIITLTIFLPTITGPDSTDVSKELVKLPTTANPPDIFVVNTERDTVLIYSTGSKITIPANAFVDESGAPVNGKVEVDYREFHNVSEILLSAIPMRYDSSGKEMAFESAGMFDIGASKDGKRVLIANDKSLEIAMATLDKTEKKFNQYVLDEKKREWSFVKKDEVTVLSRPASPAGGKTDSVKASRPFKPLNERMFTIDASGRPDLEIYNNVVFEVTKDCKTFNRNEAKTEWGMVNVEKIDKSDKYKVTFSYPLSGEPRTYSVTARPINDGNLEKAVEKYDAMYKDYKKKLSAAEKADLEKEVALKNEQNAYENVFQNYLALQKKNEALAMKNAVKVAEATQVVYRTFTIKQFGIWNSDCPQTMPQGAEVFANFEAKDGGRVNVAAVYLVEKGKNALYNLYVPKKISFTPEAENVLIVITKDHKLGWVKSDAFKDIGKSIKNHTFKLNMLDKENYTSSDIDAIII